MQPFVLSGISLGFFLAVTTTPGSSQAGQSEIPNHLTVTVHVYDFAGVPKPTVARSQREAARILRQAGIKSVWLNCPLNAEQQRSSRTCEPQHNQVKFEVRILSVSPRLGAPHNALGFAHFSDSGRPSRTASIFYDRIVELALTSACQASTVHSPSTVLAHAMAHELGHLFLGQHQHSSRGLMRAHWRRSDLQKAAAGALLFNRHQAKRMQLRLARSNRAGDSVAD